MVILELPASTVYPLPDTSHLSNLMLELPHSILRTKLVFEVKFPPINSKEFVLNVPLSKLILLHRISSSNVHFAAPLKYIFLPKSF